MKWLLTPAVLAALVTSATAQQANERCAVMTESTAGVVETHFVDGFVVTGAVPFRFPAGFENARAVMCVRDVLVIGDDDHRVIVDGGVPLYIASTGRVVVLEISGGQFRVRTARGEPTVEETVALQAALTRAQNAAQAGQP